MQNAINCALVELSARSVFRAEAHVFSACFGQLSMKADHHTVPDPLL